MKPIAETKRKRVHKARASFPADRGSSAQYLQCQTAASGELLRRYQADEITPGSTRQRAKILAEP